MTRGRDEQSYALPGLGAPAEILVDTRGIPHIYAASTYDAFRAQGFNAARDRLWQIDFWRRRGLGLLAEVFGPAYVERDRAARLFLYRGDMRDEWLAYGSDTKQATKAFVDGVNAYVQLTIDDPSLLPVEFRELGYRPALWSPEDIPRIRSHGLFYNLREEAARARTVRDYGTRVEDLRRCREPEHELVVPDGLDPGRIPDGVLHVYELATTPPTFPATAAGGPVLEGSNNWVLAGELTTTGRPLLANDPHRISALPSLRYLAHLSAPGFDVIGGGEPALPGISLGHNGRIAFGLTIFAIDQEDLYVYETAPGNPREYRYRDRYEPMDVVRETIPVAGAAPEEVELVFTRHGPVIYTDTERGTAFAVRAAWLETGMAPYLGSMDYMRAENAEEFRAAMNRWGAPPENQVYADTSGTIGWKAGGRTPVRPNWDGTLPVPGDGRYEWAGFYDADQLPGRVDPPEGWLATANEMNLPAGFPRTITYDWYSPHRSHRIAEVLGSRTGFSARDMVALQTDYVSTPARRILQRVRRLRLDDPQARIGLELLRDWDCHLGAAQAAAALFEVWYRRHLRPALLGRALAQLIPADQRAAAVRSLIPQETTLADARVDLRLVEDPGGLLGPDAEAALREVVESSLRDAVEDVSSRLGADPREWAWGSLHVARPVHPLANLLTGLPQDRTALGPVPRGGSGDTVGNTAYGPDFLQVGGATLRVVIDVGDWDSSLAMNSPGQSGDPASAHYDDLLAGWAADDAFPLLYSRARVEAATEHRIVLTP